MTAPTVPTITVVVPFRDAAAHLPSLVDALERQSLPAGQSEVVFVDNGSSDDGAGLVAAALRDGPLRGRLEALPEPPSSYAARNAGVAVARGRILAFTDADCRPRPGWLSAIVAHLDGDGPAPVLAGRVVLEVADPRNPWEVFDQAVHLDNAATAGRGRVATANMAVRRDVFAAVGPFAAVTSGGDYEWSRRARAQGHEIRFAPDVVVDHPTRTTGPALRAKLARTSRGQGEAAAADRGLLVGNTARALGRPLLLTRHLQVARSPEASDDPAFRVRLFLTSLGLRCRQVPAYFRGLLDGRSGR